MEMIMALHYFPLPGDHKVAGQGRIMLEAAFVQVPIPLTTGTRHSGVESANKQVLCLNSTALTRYPLLATSSARTIVSSCVGTIFWPG